MSSIGGILSIARSAIFANQSAIQVASHNIGNANTEGYFRQQPGDERACACSTGLGSDRNRRHRS